MVKLNKFIPLKDFRHTGDIFDRTPLDLYLPTQVTVSKPEFVVPRVARVFQTDLYAFEGKGWTGADLDDELFLRDNEFKPDGNYPVLAKSRRPVKDFPNVWCYEVWTDDGDHGRPWYTLCGYVYVSDADYPLPEDKAYPVEVGKLGYF